MIHIIHPDGRTLALDVVESLSVSNSVTVAKHPVERGAPVSDHAEPSNESLAFACKITETPTQDQKDGQGVFFGTDVTKGKSGPARVLAAVDFLKDCVGQLLDIEDARGRIAYVDVLLTQYPFDMQLVRSSAFTLGFDIPRLVEAVDVSIPAKPSVPATLVKPGDPDSGGTEPVVRSFLDFIGHKAIADGAASRARPVN